MPVGSTIADTTCKILAYMYVYAILHKQEYIISDSYKIVDLLNPPLTSA